MKTCAECGTAFTARADAAYCSPACRQRAYRNRQRRTPIRNAPVVTDTAVAHVPVLVDERFVPVLVDKRFVPVLVDERFVRHRFYRITSGGYGQSTVQQGREVEGYVFNVAAIGELCGDRPHHFTIDVDTPLPECLPADIDPDTADYLASWLERALDRAHELLALLDRRSHETDW